MKQVRWQREDTGQRIRRNKETERRSDRRMRIERTIKEDTEEDKASRQRGHETSECE